MFDDPSKDAWVINIYFLSKCLLGYVDINIKDKNSVKILSPWLLLPLVLKRQLAYFGFLNSKIKIILIAKLFYSAYSWNINILEVMLH